MQFNVFHFFLNNVNWDKKKLYPFTEFKFIELNFILDKLWHLILILFWFLEMLMWHFIKISIAHLIPMNPLLQKVISVSKKRHWHTVSNSLYTVWSNLNCMSFTFCKHLKFENKWITRNAIHLWTKCWRKSKLIMEIYTWMALWLLFQEKLLHSQKCTVRCTLGSGGIIGLEDFFSLKPTRWSNTLYLKTNFLVVLFLRRLTWAGHWALPI